MQQFSEMLGRASGRPAGGRVDRLGIEIREYAVRTRQEMDSMRICAAQIRICTELRSCSANARQLFIGDRHSSGRPACVHIRYTRAYGSALNVYEMCGYKNSRLFEQGEVPISLRFSS